MTNQAEPQNCSILFDLFKQVQAGKAGKHLIDNDIFFRDGQHCLTLCYENKLMKECVIVARWNNSTKKLTINTPTEMLELWPTRSQESLKIASEMITEFVFFRIAQEENKKLYDILLKKRLEKLKVRLRTILRW